MPIRVCLYCDKEIDKADWRELFQNPSLLCENCRKQLKAQWRTHIREEKKIHYFYAYEEGIFRELLLQYKEAHDEILAPIFLQDYLFFLMLRFRGYQIVIPPSSQKKLQQRGFVPMAEITKGIHLPYKQVAMKIESTQEGKNLQERKAMRTNFYEKSSFSKKDKILIMDDVFTSGSTVLGLYELLKEKVKKIEIVVLAVRR